MPITKKPDHLTRVKKARFIAQRMSGSWNVLVFKAHFYESLARLEHHDRRYQSAAQNASRSAASRQYHARLGDMLARLLLDQGAMQEAGRVHEKACKNRQQVLQVRSLKKYSFKIRQLAGFLENIIAV